MEVQQKLPSVDIIRGVAAGSNNDHDGKIMLQYPVTSTTSTSTTSTRPAPPRHPCPAPPLHPCPAWRFHSLQCAEDAFVVVGAATIIEKSCLQEVVHCFDGIGRQRWGRAVDEWNRLGAGGGNGGSNSGGSGGGGGGGGREITFRVTVRKKSKLWKYDGGTSAVGRTLSDLLEQTFATDSGGSSGSSGSSGGSTGVSLVADHMNYDMEVVVFLSCTIHRTHSTLYSL
jgi:hypothetical protein